MVISIRTSTKNKELIATLNQLLFKISRDSWVGSCTKRIELILFKNLINLYDSQSIILKISKSGYSQSKAYLVGFGKIDEIAYYEIFQKKVLTKKE